MKTGSGEGRNSEDDINRRLGPDLFLGHLQHLYFSYPLLNAFTPTRESGFLTTGKFTQVPINGLISTVVGGGTESDLGDDIGGVGRDGDLQLHILGGDLLAEVGDHLNVDLEGGTTLPSHP